MPDEIALPCGRTACSSGADVRGYNRVTHKLYCLECAHRIESARDPAQEPFFPLLRVEITEGGFLAEGAVIVNIKKVVPC